MPAITQTIVPMPTDSSARRPHAGGTLHRHRVEQLVAQHHTETRLGIRCCNHSTRANRCGTRSRRVANWVCCRLGLSSRIRYRCNGKRIQYVELGQQVAAMTPEPAPNSSTEPHRGCAGIRRPARRHRLNSGETSGAVTKSPASTELVPAVCVIAQTWHTGPFHVASKAAPSAVCDRPRQQGPHVLQQRRFGVRQCRQIQVRVPCTRLNGKQARVDIVSTRSAVDISLTIGKDSLEPSQPGREKTALITGRRRADLVRPRCAICMPPVLRWSSTTVARPLGRGVTRRVARDTSAFCSHRARRPSPSIARACETAIAF